MNSPKPHGMTGKTNALKGEETRSEPLCLRVEPSLMEKIEWITDNTGISKSQLVINALEEHLKD